MSMAKVFKLNDKRERMHCHSK